ncbi:hypothetical protein Dimus_013887 [Dionaea muscipula]
MRSRRLGHLYDLDPEIERTLRSIRAKRRLEFNTQNQEGMEDPLANHNPAANGAANQRPLHEYATPQGNLPSKTEVNPREHVNAITLRSGRALGETSEQEKNVEIEKNVEHEWEERAENDEERNETNGKGKVEDQFVEKWENLFKRRELVHTDAVKEFYAKMTVIHLKKKDIVKSKVRGVEVEFDHEKLATILGILGNNGICEYVKDVWEESKYIKPLEITRSGENRRRDEEVEAPEEEEEEEEERKKDDFDWEAVIDEATVEGESGSDDQFYDAQVEVEEPVTETQAAPAVPASSLAQQQDQEPSGVDPSGPTGREAEFLKFQAEFERKRANRFHDDLEKAKARKCRTLSLTPPSPNQIQPLEFPITNSKQFFFCTKPI